MEKQKRVRPLGQGMGRMLNHGMAPADFMKLMNKTDFNCFNFSRIENGEDFITAAVSLGDQDVAYAEKQLKLGHKVTAGKFFLNASALYRVADYGLIEPTEEKLSIYKKLVDTFRRGKELSIYDKPVHVEIPFEHSTMPGYLTIPDGAGKDVPVVIVIPGATGYKEENYGQAYKLWERGIATLIFDGPGQGEAMLFRKYVYRVDNYEKAVKAVIDFVRADSRVGKKVAIIGISYGGYLAPRTACFYSKELAACVGRGGLAKTDDLTLPKNHAYLRNFKVKFNEPDEDKAVAISHQMTIEPYVKNITCPLLVQHTEQDFVVGTEGAHYIYEHASSKDKELYRILPLR
jgi:dienelactone hydrolase